MKDLLNRIGVIDLFAYLSPGAILLLSLVFWVNPKQEPTSYWEPMKNSVVLIGLLICFAYALGLFATSAGSALARYAEILAEAKKPRQSILGRIYQALIENLFGIGDWKAHFGMQARQTELQQTLNKYAGLKKARSLVPTIWDQKSLYRVLVIDDL